MIGYPPPTVSLVKFNTSADKPCSSVTGSTCMTQVGTERPSGKYRYGGMNSSGVRKALLSNQASTKTRIQGQDQGLTVVLASVLAVPFSVATALSAPVTWAWRIR